MLLSLLVSAQSRHTLVAVPQDNIRLPWGLKNLSVVDGRLFGCSGGVVVGSAMAHDMLYALQPDTISHIIGDDFDYVVRNPRDRRLYYTHHEIRSGKERVLLYVHTGGRWHKNKQVEIRGWYKNIYHPTFSPDGNMMVFSSQNKVGLGGYDLWCTFWNGKRWSKPINMGGAINSSGNEICPVFYNNDLIFSSNLEQNGDAYHFYTVRLPKDVTSENIIFGRFCLQRMAKPLNSDSNDIELAVDVARNCGYWISDRGGRQELYTFKGTLAGVMIKGVVLDEGRNLIADADVSVVSGGRVVNTFRTDSTGAYRLLVNPDEKYELRVEKNGYFISTTPVSTTTCDSLLIGEEYREVTLHKLLFNRTLVFDHLYHGDEVEFYTHSAEDIAPVVDFVRDNPNVQLQITLQSDQTTDSVYNNLLIEYRIKYLHQYLKSVLPSESKISLINGNEKDKNEAKGSGDNSVFVILFNEH